MRSLRYLPFSLSLALSFLLESCVETDQPDNALAEVAQAASSVCISCLQVRVGRPFIVRGPSADEIDTFFNEIEMPNGSHRGFVANANTYGVTGADPWSMGGSRRQALGPRVKGTFDECGRWLNDTEVNGTTVRGFYLAGKSCDYSRGQTHKSMGYATSADYSLSWSVHGQIITGTDAPKAGVTTGEGDCTVSNGGDGYLYAYCLRNRDYRTIVSWPAHRRQTPCRVSGIVVDGYE